MSMEISNNYSNYAATNNVMACNKTENVESDRSKKTYRSSSEYKNFLAEKYDCLKSKEYSVEINGSLATKAANDEKTAQWLEYNLSLIPGAVEKMRASAEARGTKVLSCNIKINGYDDMTTEIVTQDVVETGTEKAKKELEEKIKKAREEKKAEEEKAAKRAEEKKAENEKIEKEQAEKRIEEAKNSESKFSITGESVESVTRSVVSAISGNTGTTVSFDIKV